MHTGQLSLGGRSLVLAFDREQPRSSGGACGWEEPPFRGWDGAPNAQGAAPGRSQGVMGAIAPRGSHLGSGGAPASLEHHPQGPDGRLGRPDRDNDHAG